jgi:uncharacterized membrane protein YphA (DoxX/SURF4 family)
MAASRVVLRVLLAAVFVVSAVAKLLAIDDFELYVFSYGFMPLTVTYIATRLCIVAEFLLGVLIAVGWWRKWVNLAAMAMLLLFSIFLCYAALMGRTDSCQCMGRLVNMPPAVSLLKNAALIVLVLFYMRYTRNGEGGGCINKRWKRCMAVVMGVAVLVAVFTISVPDSWMFSDEEMLYDKELLKETLEERQLDEGHKIVAFVTPGCPYCRMSREKISSIAKRHELDTTDIIYLEPADIGSERFLGITYGNRPLIMMLDNGVPQATYHYRNISERKIAAFLKD